MKSAIAALGGSRVLETRSEEYASGFANSILTRNAEEAITKIRKSFRFDDKPKRICNSDHKETVFDEKSRAY